MKLFKSFKQFVFSNLFDFYYKENDTYKDSQGRGILERFIGICSEYLDEAITPSIDQIVKLIDVEDSIPLYHNYLWDMFGQIPYAYGCITNGEPFTPDNYARWVEQTSKIYPKADSVQALKYAIRLFQIRGTERFFQLLARFYDVKLDIFDIPSGIDTSIIYDNLRPDKLIRGVFPFKSPTGQRDFKLGVYSGIGACWPIDNCNSCSIIYFRVRLSPEKYTALEAEGKLDNVKRVFISIFNKYLPVDVMPFDEVNNPALTLIKDVENPITPMPLTTEVLNNLPALTYPTEYIRVDSEQW